MASAEIPNYESEMGKHSFFEEFPFLLKAYNKQVIWWNNRPLIVQQNNIGGGKFVLDFMGEEFDELKEAIVSGKKKDIEEEAADVGIVAFTAPAFLSTEEWAEVGSDVVHMLKNAIILSGMTHLEYAERVVQVIEGKNNRNHLISAHLPLPPEVSEEGVDILYKATRKELKVARYDPNNPAGKVLPVQANTVVRMNGEFDSSSFGHDPYYQLLVARFGVVEAVRSTVIKEYSQLVSTPNRNVRFPAT